MPRIERVNIHGGEISVQDKKKDKKEKAKGGEAKPAEASKDEPRVDQLDIR